MPPLAATSHATTASDRPADAPASAGLVLLLTHRHDFYTIDKVAEAVQARGGEALRIDTDRFPLEAAIELGFEGGQRSARLQYQGA